MRYALALVALLTLLMLSSCVTTYKAVGAFQEYNEVFIGDVNANLWTGGGTFSMVGKVTGIECHGTSIVTRLAMTCTGQEGEIYANCSDGRSVTGEWRATSCTTGFGRGKDSMGSAFIFTFGYSETQAIAKIESELQRAKSKPSLPTYNPKAERKKKGFSTGTGFFIAENGFILTNYHVIDEATEIKIITNDGKTYSANVVSKDPANDIAIIKIEKSYPAISLVSTGRTRKADEVMTLGFPLVTIQGQEQKATFGRINALSGAKDDVRFFQIDVPIQPGNSGGPLLNETGNVIGIVTATLNQVNVYKESGLLPQNVNYAVKSDYAFPLIYSAGIKLRKSTNNKKREFGDVIIDAERSIVFVVTK